MVKTTIPNKYRMCNKQLYFTEIDKNYIYHRGKYICKDCWNFK